MVKDHKLAHCTVHHEDVQSTGYDFWAFALKVRPTQFTIEVNERIPPLLFFATAAKHRNRPYVMKAGMSAQSREP